MSGDAEPTGTGASDSSEEGDIAPEEYLESLVLETGAGPVAIEIGRVDRVVEDPGIDRLPRTGPAIAGATAAGGGVAVVIDLPAFLSGDPSEDGEPRVVLLADHGHEQAAGFRVCSPYEIRNLPVEELVPVDEADPADLAVPPEHAVAVAPDGDTTPTAVLDVPGIVGAAIDEDRPEISEEEVGHDTAAAEERADGSEEGSSGSGEPEQGFQFPE